MTAELRIAVIGLAAFATAGVMAALIVPFAMPWSRPGTAAVRARRLVTLRLLPAGVAVAFGTMVTAALLRFEPRHASEEIGVLIPALALLAAMGTGTACRRWFQLIRSTRRLVRQWLVAAEPVALAGISARAFAVSSTFPIVAVVGLRRPRLIIARSVLASCSPDELCAILAHEQGHIDRRDNLRRLLLSVMPDVLAWLPISDRLIAAWRDAAEEAADDDAARRGRDARLCLASALIKVARLAPPAPGAAMLPASALYRGENLDRRIHRLLNAAPAAVLPTRSRWRAWLATAVLVAGGVLALDVVHTALEATIQRLP